VTWLKSYPTWIITSDTHRHTHTHTLDVTRIIFDVNQRVCGLSSVLYMLKFEKSRHLHTCHSARDLWVSESTRMKMYRMQFYKCVRVCVCEGERARESIQNTVSRCALIVCVVWYIFIFVYMYICEQLFVMYISNAFRSVYLYLYIYIYAYVHVLYIHNMRFVLYIYICVYVYVYMFFFYICIACVLFCTFFYLYTCISVHVHLLYVHNMRFFLYIYICTQVYLYMFIYLIYITCDLFYIFIFVYMYICICSFVICT